MTLRLQRWWGSGPPHQRCFPRTIARPADDRGMVIVEAAVVIPVMAMVALVLAWGVSVTVDVMTLADATRQAARDIARGVSIDDAVLQAQRRAPDAVLLVEESGDLVTVTAEDQVAPPLGVLEGLRFPVRQAVSIPREWS